MRRLLCLWGFLTGRRGGWSDPGENQEALGERSGEALGQIAGENVLPTSATSTTLKEVLVLGINVRIQDFFKNSTKIIKIHRVLPHILFACFLKYIFRYNIDGTQDSAKHRMPPHTHSARNDMSPECH